MVGRRDLRRGSRGDLPPYTVFDSKEYLRFLVPAWPFVMLGLAHVLLLPLRVVSGIRPCCGRSRSVWSPPRAAPGCARHQCDPDDRRTIQAKEARYVTVATRLREISGDNAIVLAVQHSVSVRYYAGRMTLAFEALPPAWLDKPSPGDRAVSIHAVLEDWEIRNLRSRYAGQATSALVRHAHRPHRSCFVFDLKPIRRRRFVTEVIEADLSCRPPAPPRRSLAVTGERGQPKTLAVTSRTDKRFVTSVLRKGALRSIAWPPSLNDAARRAGASLARTAVSIASRRRRVGQRLDVAERRSALEVNKNGRDEKSTATPGATSFTTRPGSADDAERERPA